MTCTHTTKRDRWIPPSDDCGPGDWGYEPGHWEYETVSTTEDIDAGRFKCTQCNLVMYYTGLWRDFWEKGIPCSGSEKVKRNA